MKITRYDVIPAHVIETDGDWVRYEDVVALEERKEELEFAAASVLAFCQTMKPSRQKPAEKEAWQRLREVVYPPKESTK